MGAKRGGGTAAGDAVEGGADDGGADQPGAGARALGELERELAKRGVSYGHLPRGISVPSRGALGFGVVLWDRGDEALVFCGGWHEHFREPAQAVTCFLDALTQRMRLQVVRRGRTETRWTLERLRGGSWGSCGTTGLLLVPFWRKRELVTLRNEPPEPEGGDGPAAIRRREMMAPMLAACPSFAPAHEAHVLEWEGEPAEYVELSELARHLIEKLAAGDDEGLARTFEVVERWQVEGDAFVREAATVGLLEDLQNEALHRTTKPGGFVRFLGPASRVGWEAVERFWAGGR